MNPRVGEATVHGTPNAETHASTGTRGLRFSCMNRATGDSSVSVIGATSTAMVPPSAPFESVRCAPLDRAPCLQGRHGQNTRGIGRADGNRRTCPAAQMHPDEDTAERRRATWPCTRLLDSLGPQTPLFTH